MNYEKIIDTYFDDSMECLQNMKKNIKEILQVSNILKEARDKGKRVFIFGNGGSGSTASHFVCDLNKTSSLSNKRRFQSYSLVDNIPISLAYGNDVSFESIFVEQLKNLSSPGDVIIAISGSGNSKNVINAVNYAKKEGCIIIGLTGFDGGLLEPLCDECIVIPSDSMYRIEDMHLMLNHILTSIFREGTNYK